MLKKYESIINEVAFTFTKKFFLEQYQEEATEEDYQIMGDLNIGLGWICVNRGVYSFQIDEIITLLNNNWHTDIIIEYYDFCMENDAKPGISFYHYGLKKVLGEKEYNKIKEEDLKKSEEKVKEAKEILTECIKNNIK